MKIIDKSTIAKTVPRKKNYPPTITVHSDGTITMGCGLLSVLGLHYNREAGVLLAEQKGVLYVAATKDDGAFRPNNMCNQWRFSNVNLASFLFKHFGKTGKSMKLMVSTKPEVIKERNWFQIQAYEGRIHKRIKR